MDNRFFELLTKAIMLPFAIIFVLILGLRNFVIGTYRFLKRMVIILWLRSRENEVTRLRTRIRTPNYNPFDQRYNQHMDPELIEKADRMEAENEAIKQSLIDEINQEKFQRAIRNLQDR